MEYETISYAMDGPLATATLNRPERANAISVRLGQDLHRVIDAVEADPAVRVLIVTGRGRHFSAGADLKEILSNQERPASWLDDLRHAFLRLEELDRPTIAAINGPAMGGGCELAISCDLRIMAEDAIIGVPEIQFGGLPFAGGTQRLPRLIGRGKAKELCFTGEPIGAAEAHRVGLVNRVVPPAELMTAARDLGRALAARSRLALTLAKSAIDVGGQLDLKSGLILERQVAELLLRDTVGQAEAREQAAMRSETYQRIFEAADRGEPNG